jgi:DNA-binding GntR family transcriptional regulator
MKKIESDQQSLAKKVYEALRNAIILGELVPGSLHSVPSLAAALQTSRTPVREALLKLADQGMVRFERNRGTRILQTTIHDLEEMFSLRLLLEVPATYRAAQQAGPQDLKAMADALAAMRRAAASRSSSPREHLAPDSRFHRAIALASGNKRLATIVETLFDLQMTRGVSTWGINREIADICNDHETIYQRIAAGDAMGAALAMRDHIALTARIIIAQETGNVAEAGALGLPYMDVLALLGQPASRPPAASDGAGEGARAVRRRQPPARGKARPK